MAVAGAFLYNYVSATHTAEGKLAVPLKSFTDYDNIVNGRALAERVAAKLGDGSTPEEIDNQLAGNFSAGTRLLPLYAVSATDEDPARAALIANTAMDESMGLFRESQAAQLDYVRTSFRAERDKAEEEALAAHTEFDRFLAENNAYALPTRLAQQAQLVSELRLQAGLEDSFLPPSSSEPGDLGAAQAELERLLALEPEYNRLQLQARLAQSEISSLEAEVRSLELGGEGFADAKAAVEEELNAARDKLTEAQTAVTTFESGNGVKDLPATVRSQQQVVNNLLLVEATNGGLTIADESLATAESALEHMRGLQPEYNRLAREVEQAEKVLDVREEQDLFVVQQTLPTDSQVEVVERAQLKSAFWWTAIRYAVAVFVAVFISLLLVYVLCFFEKAPPTIQDLEGVLGSPIIGRVPRGASS
jgi:capsular polysaccharide biosynthesis protein